MAKRKIAEVTGTLSKAEGGVEVRARVYWDSDYREYVVKSDHAGQHIANADYFTSDKEDALDTAHYICNKVRSNGQ